jgi:hypothetical protein
MRFPKNRKKLGMKHQLRGCNSGPTGQEGFFLQFCDVAEVPIISKVATCTNVKESRKKIKIFLYFWLSFGTNNKNLAIVDFFIFNFS